MYPLQFNNIGRVYPCYFDVSYIENKIYSLLLQVTLRPK